MNVRCEVRVLAQRDEWDRRPDDRPAVANLDARQLGDAGDVHQALERADLRLALLDVQQYVRAAGDDACLAFPGRQRLDRLLRARGEEVLRHCRSLPRMAARTRSGVAGMVRIRRPDRAGDGVDDRRRGGQHGRFAQALDAERSEAAGHFDEDHFELRHGLDRGQVVIGKAGGVAGQHLFHQGRADAHEHRAFDLPLGIRPVHGMAHVVRGRDPQHAYLACPQVHLDLGHVRAGDEEGCVLGPGIRREVRRQVEDAADAARLARAGRTRPPLLPGRRARRPPSKRRRPGRPATTGARSSSSAATPKTSSRRFGTRPHDGPAHEVGRPRGALDAAVGRARRVRVDQGHQVPVDAERLRGHLRPSSCWCPARSRPRCSRRRTSRPGRISACASTRRSPDLPNRYHIPAIPTPRL